MLWKRRFEIAMPERLGWQIPTGRGFISIKLFKVNPFIIRLIACKSENKYLFLLTHPYTPPFEGN